MMRAGAVALCVSLVFTVDSAMGHAPFVGADGFYAGLLHPLSVPAHLIALVALGLLIVQQPADARNSHELVFSAGLVAGLVAIACAIGETPAQAALVAATAMSGSLVALARPLRAPPLWALAAVTGAAIGLDSPPQVVSLRLAAEILVGTAFGGALALVLIVEAAGRLTRDWQRIGIRIVGSWMAASAVLVLALRFARN